MTIRLPRILLLKLLIPLVLIPLTNMLLPRVTTAESNHRQHRIARIHFLTAVNAAKKFACREPQTRAYHLKDLLQSVHGNPAESASQPIYIVLKRCDGHSGCCNSSDMSCSPVRSSIYHEELEIETWNLVTNKTRRQWIRVEQHGRCTCEITTVNDRYQMELQQPDVVPLRTERSISR